MRTRGFMAFAGERSWASAGLCPRLHLREALSGGAVLSAGSWVFMFAVFGGAYALAYFLRKF